MIVYYTRKNRKSLLKDGPYFSLHQAKCAATINGHYWVFRFHMISGHKTVEVTKISGKWEKWR